MQFTADINNIGINLMNPKINIKQSNLQQIQIMLKLKSMFKKMIILKSEEILILMSMQNFFS